MLAMVKMLENDGSPQSRADATVPSANWQGNWDSSGSEWHESVRERALADLEAAGIPTRRSEYWKYTDASSLGSLKPIPAPLAESSQQPIFSEIDRLRVCYVDGELDGESSDALAMTAVEICEIADAIADSGHWCSELYGRLERRGQTPIARPFASINTIGARAGLAVKASGIASKPLAIEYKRESTDADIGVRHCFKIEENASLTVLETGSAAARMNKVIEIEVADGGTFHHVQVQGRDQGRRAVTHIFAKLGSRSRFNTFTLTANGALTRNECIVELAGSEGRAQMSGAAVGDGDFHHDDTVFVTHDALDCESRQVFKKVLRNGATGVFQGKILVKPGAQKTDGYQISQALLLDEDSQFLAKPELEIYADDVACSHGSTCGGVDADALFYLRSRGIREDEASEMLSLAFLMDAIEEIEDKRFTEDLRRLLKDWLTRHR